MNLFSPNRLLTPLLLTAVSSWVLSACFTGIESTPTVTTDNVKRESASARTNGDNPLADIALPPADQWTQGMRFHVTSPRLSTIVSSPGATTSPLHLDEGSTITFLALDTITTVTGTRLPRLHFINSQGLQFYFRPDAPADTLSVPFTIPESVIELSARRLVNKKFYLLTSDWYTATEPFTPRTGRKFIVATVDSVTPGNSVFPLRVYLRTDDGDNLSILLSVGSRHTTSRRFDQLLSTTDPRQRYPEISDKTWALIQRGLVAEDMTLAECRLALGQPASVDRRAGYSSLREVWTYENGKYLIFEDGLLRSFRQ